MAPTVIQSVGRSVGFSVHQYLLDVRPLKTFPLLSLPSVPSQCASRSATLSAVPLPGETCAFLPGTALMLLTAQQRSLSHQLTTMPSVWMEPLLRAPGLPNLCFACFLDQVAFLFEWILPPHLYLPSRSKKSLSWSMSLCNNVGKPNKQGIRGFKHPYLHSGASNIWWVAQGQK